MKQLKTDFDLFVGKLSSNEFLKGEPKGSQLSLQHGRLLLEILEAHRNVTVSMFFLIHTACVPASLSGTSYGTDSRTRR